VPFRKLALVLLLSSSAFAAEAPLPALRIEPTGGGSIMYVRNTGSAPLAAFLIELVNYPGSSYSFSQDDITHEAVPAGSEQRIQVTNMTIGAVPEYVKMQAALYADGSTSGIPEKITELIDRRRFGLETLHTLIERLEKAHAAATPKTSVIADLKQWADSLQPAGKSKRNSQTAINQAAARVLVADTAASLEQHSLEEILTLLQAAEQRASHVNPR